MSRWCPSGTSAVRVARVVSTSRDITAAKGTEERLQGKVTAREDLIREADHRIKNSLHVVADLLRLQQKRTGNPAAEVLGKAAARVMAVAEAGRGSIAAPICGRSTCTRF
ncbi:histidine kinase dimerization/phosphoacceptor domain -containing protein [Dankookia sp. P2]|uniref:histidine kinase dimerization/phosphoacceptor domain -containing protein n=1 Tax=Dankookia sp. P2 TaxID=3423955 RepID=UPI003D67C215